MPVNIANSEYNEGLPKWTRCRDAIDGTDAVKAAKERYLPKMESMSVNGYNGYVKRALFDNMSTRLLQGFSGIITRRAPELEYPDEMAPHFEDATLTGKSFLELFKLVTDEILTTGRAPLLVDKPTGGGRAYIIPQKAEQLINWSQNGNDPMSLAVLEEMHVGHAVGDQFVPEYTTQYRALILTNEGYVVQIYRMPAGTVTTRGINSNGSVYHNNATKTPDLIQTFSPNIKGVPLKEIPLIVITPLGVDLDVMKPPVLDIVDVNLSHYRSSADLEQGRHWVSLPVPIVSGVEADTVLKVGSETAWILPDKDARAYYLEFQGQGLKSLENALAEKQSQMVQFSSRLMDTSTRGSEAADAVKLRNMSDSASLTSLAYAIEAGLNKAYKTIAVWEELDPDSVNITLNKDFVNTTLTAADINAYVDAYLNKTIDEETFLFNLKRGDQLPPGKSRMTTKPEDVNDGA